MASEIKVNTIKDLGGNTIVSSNGSGTITGLPASAISSGTVATARLGSGTASSSTFLAGDSSYKTVSGTTINNNADNRVITGSGTANTLEAEANLLYNNSTGNIDTTIAGNGTAGISFKTTTDHTANDKAYIGVHTTSNYGGHLVFTRGGSDGYSSESMRIDNAGKVGIGEDVPQQKLHIADASSNGVYQVFTNNDTGHTASNGLLIGIDSNEDSLFWNYENKKTYFGTNGTTRMQILASNANSGSLVVGGTSWDTWYHFQMRFNGNSGGAMVLDNSETDTNGTAYIQFKQGNSAIGYISRNGTNNSVSYSTSSDYRLKENVSYDFDATTRLKELKPARFNWKSNPSEIVDGFLAHEVSSVIPEAITGTKDETETKQKVVISSDGKIFAEWIEEADWIKGKADNTYEDDTTWEATKVVPKYQQIDQSKLVPLLVKTIQELEARIKTLEDA